MTATVSIVICTYNRLDCLRDAVASVLSQLHDSSELIVVNDGSTDGTTAWLETARQTWPKNAHAFTQSNQGLSTARNAGWQKSSGEWIVYLDDDAVAPEDWLGRMTAVLRAAASQIGVVGGPIRLRWDQPAPAWLPVSLHMWLTCYEPSHLPFTSADDALFRGANMACRRSALARVNGFSTALGRKGGNLLSREECDLAEKLRAAGYLTRFEPQPWVWHRVHAERLRRTWFWRRLYWEGISLQIDDPYLRGLSPTRRKARALLYGFKMLLQPGNLLRAFYFTNSQLQTEAVSRLSFHFGFARGIWGNPSRH